MNANELRIGNLAKYGDGILTIDINVLRDFNIYLESGIKPIPITEEWLFRFGFEKIENNWKVLDYVCFKLSWERLAGLVLVFDNESIFLPHIKYVHQLQNLYFALTGEELTLKTEL